MKHPIPQQSFLVIKQKFNSLSSYPLSMEKGRKATKTRLLHSLVLRENRTTKAAREIRTKLQLFHLNQTKLVM